MSSTWIVAPDGKPLTPGMYRLSGTIAAPYNDTVRKALEAGLRVQVIAKGEVPKVFASSPPLYSSGGRLEPWPFSLTFEHPQPSGRVEAGIDPRAFLLIVAGVVTLGLTFVLISSKLEKLITTTSDEVIKPILDPLAQLLSPGTIVLAIVGMFIFLRARRA